MYEKKEGAK